MKKLTIDNFTLCYENTNTRGCDAGIIHGDQTAEKCKCCKYFPCRFFKHSDESCLANTCNEYCKNVK